MCMAETVCVSYSPHTHTCSCVLSFVCVCRFCSPVCAVHCSLTLYDAFAPVCICSGVFKSLALSFTRYSEDPLCIFCVSFASFVFSLMLLFHLDFSVSRAYSLRRLTGMSLFHFHCFWPCASPRTSMNMFCCVDFSRCLLS